MTNLLLSLVAVSAFAFGSLAIPKSHSPLLVQTEHELDYADTKVPVILGVMSRCPDALLCESVFDHVLKKVIDRVDLSLSFIGAINATEPTFGVTCKHGPLECAGNVQELCALKYADATQFWEFLQCQNYQGRDKIGLAETALQCANTAKIDWEASGVGACTGLDGSGTASEGVQLLQESVRASQELGIKNSCTVLINGKQVCIHDGTWKQCENGHTPHDFIKQINEEYNRLNGINTDDRVIV
ncbi:uncharacterized protein FIBRA_01441 [Fibroporia radiculosa]|uniref:Gamma interferon inducible lysosomal thiol reductase GILT n=1 Tax=Fibroporia radiculosa TaxID=599839 RepID=J4G0Z7_9APHY|nr:uncharacterized protein FIBRA_01441 [Fibroporia radiculosa]CCL99423.1 predicted protein [Fibroporia radiculosa]